MRIFNYRLVSSDLVFCLILLKKEQIVCKKQTKTVRREEDNVTVSEFRSLSSEWRINRSKTKVLLFLFLFWSLKQSDGPFREWSVEVAYHDYRRGRSDKLTSSSQEENDLQENGLDNIESTPTNEKKRVRHEVLLERKNILTCKLSKGRPSTK